MPTVHEEYADVEDTYNYDDYEPAGGGGWDAGYMDWFSSSGISDAFDLSSPFSSISVGEVTNGNAYSFWQNYEVPSLPGMVQSWSSTNTLTGDEISGQTWYNSAGESVMTSFAYTANSSLEFYVVDSNGTVLNHQSTMLER